MTTPILSPADRRILDECPNCHDGHLYTVYDGEYTNFLCRTCLQCWHVGFGWARRVDPDTCPGCEWQGTCRSRCD